MSDQVRNPEDRFSHDATQTNRPNLRVFRQKDANGIANNEDPDQKGPLGVVCTVCPDLLSKNFGSLRYMSLVMKKTAFCICENKDADELRGNRETGQHLCFCYTDSTIPILSKSEISSL